MSKASRQAWVKAFRPRTLPLAAASIGMGGFMAAWQNSFSGPVFGLCLLTALLLQILSNLANDYGDTVHGADSDQRTGPARMVQSGQLTSASVRRMMMLFVFLSLASGLSLLWISFGNAWLMLGVFLCLGVAAIIAAITYTSGKKPYGYAGLGDIAVFLFFGWVGGAGTWFLQVQDWQATMLLPSGAVGLLATAVLNVNNIRDIYSDEGAGKKSIPVRLGLYKARIYHACLITGALLLATIYVVLSWQGAWQLLYVVVLPLFVYNATQVFNTEPSSLDPYLRQTALTTLLFVVFYGIGFLMVV